MEKIRLLTIGLTVLLTGCAGLGKQEVQTVSIYNEDQAIKLMQPGKNTIKGSAVLRQNNGGVVTCAGREVNLTPATDYAMERVVALYGSADRGYNPAGIGGRKIEFPNTPPGYAINRKKTTCDAQGYFKFEKVADGDFYVTAPVIWQVNPYFPEGGNLMQRVSVSGGETKEIVLSR